ncbi:MAG: phosphate ABC transporter permease subunit PstC [Nitrososphaerales archaeon]
MPRNLSDRIYKYVTALLSGSAILFIFAIGFILVKYSYPSIVYNGINFFTSSVWNPRLDANVVVVNGISVLQGSSYGILVFIEGTLISSGLAVLFGVPAGIAIAIFLTQISPRRLAGPISFLVELLAGIPSVVYGFWGLLVLVPYLQYTLEPAMSKYLSFFPLFSGPVYSGGLLASGLILALMIVPIIAALSRDMISQTPIELKEGAKALGLTNWETTRRIVLPYAKSGIFGAVILGLGRALGETMAVALVSGSALYAPHTLFYPINSMAAFMALSLDSAFTDPTNMYVYALVELAVVLLLITVVVNVLARALVRQGFISSADKVVRV